MSSTRQRALIPRKRQRRGARRVETIVAAAAVLFGARGFDGTSMNAIAKASDLTIGSLYQYFPSRDAIIDAVAEQYLRTWRAYKAEFIERVASATLHEYFRIGVTGMFDLFSRYEGVKAFLDADPQRAPSVRAVQQEVAPFRTAPRAVLPERCIRRARARHVDRIVDGARRRRDPGHNRIRRAASNVLRRDRHGMRRLCDRAFR